MTRRHPRKLREKAGSPYLWHRWLGLCAAPLVVLLVISGWLLNHAVDLELDQRHVESEWVLERYGLKPEIEPIHGLALDPEPISLYRNRLYLGSHLITAQWSALHSASMDSEWLVVSDGTALILATRQGQLIERIDADALPTEPNQVQLNNRALLIRDSSGITFSSADGGLSWSSASWPETKPPTTVLLPPDLAQHIRADARSHQISWHRVLADFHSGRLLGTAGVWLVDIVGLLLLLLACTGPWLWWRQMRAARRRRQRHSEHKPG